MVTVPLTADLELDGPGQGWTDATRELLVRGGVSFRYGFPGGGPKDTTAGIGACQMLVDNSVANSLRQMGYASPGHALARQGLDLGIGCRLTLGTGAHRRRKLFYLDAFRPTFGPDAERAVAVSGTDYMGVAARSPMTGFELHALQRSDALIDRILDHVRVPPRARVLAQGRDSYEFAGDDLRRQSSALEALHRVTLSERGYLAADADDADGETLTFLDRLGRTSLLASVDPATVPRLTHAAAATITRDRSAVVDMVRVGIRTRQTDATPTVLYELGAVTEVAPGATIHPGGPYRDPDQTAQEIAGIDMVLPVAGTDYAINSAPDGSGTDLTGQFVVMAAFGGSDVRWTITSQAAVPGYVLYLRCRGRARRNYAVSYVEASTGDLMVDPRSDSVLTLDLPYQQDSAVAQDIADRLLTIYGKPVTRMSSITIHAARDEAMATLATTLGLHDLIDVIDEPSGVMARHFVHSVSVRIGDPNDVRVTFGLTQASDIDANVWVLDESALNQTTKLGSG